MNTYRYAKWVANILWLPAVTFALVAAALKDKPPAIVAVIPDIEPDEHWTVERHPLELALTSGYKTSAMHN